MMIQGKKGIEYTFIIVMFTFIALSGVFTMIFTKEIGSTEILDPILNATLTVEKDLNVSAAMQAHAIDLKQRYDNITIPYDLFFLGLWITAIWLSITAAIRARTESAYSFFGSLFIGMLFFLAVVFFVDQIQFWFFDQLFNPLFSDATLNIPIIDYYFNNLAWISALWFLILLFINKINLNVELRGRVEQ